MRLTNQQIFDSSGALKELGDKEIPIDTSFSISTVLSKVNEVLKIINSERDRLLNRYGEKDADGGLIQHADNTVSITDPAGFQADMGKLLACEVEMDVEPINRAALGNRIDVKPFVLMTLDWLLVK
jgi:hypothetical protein